MTMRNSICDGCGTNEKVECYESREENLCPRCATLNDRYEAAEESLTQLLQQTLQPWLAHWDARGLSRGEAAEILTTQAGILSEDWSPPNNLPWRHRFEGSVEKGTPA